MKIINKGLLQLSASFLLAINSLCSAAQLELTDAFTPTISPASNFGEFVAKLSADGSYAISINEQSAGEAGDDAATLYQNVNGTLERVAGVDIGTLGGFISIDTGTISDDFTRLVIGADNGATGQAFFYSVNTSNNSITLLATAPLPGYVVPTGALNTTLYSYTSDSKYVTIVYCNDSVGFTSRLAVFDANTGALVAYVDGLVGFSNGANFFNICGKHGSSSGKHGRLNTYISVGATALEASVFPNVSFKAPSIWYIYKFDATSGTLSLVSSIDQPQFIDSATPFTYKCGSSTLISVTTSLALNPNEPTVFQPSAFANPPNTFITGDDKNRKIYSFDGRNATLLSAQHFDVLDANGGFYPNGKAIAYAEGVGSAGQSIQPIGFATALDFVSLKVKKHSITFKPIFETTSLPGGPAFPYFSANGIWMIVGGSTLPTGTAVNGIALFQIVK